MQTVVWLRGAMAPILLATIAAAQPASEVGLASLGVFKSVREITDIGACPRTAAGPQSILVVGSRGWVRCDLAGHALADSTKFDIPQQYGWLGNHRLLDQRNDKPRFYEAGSGTTPRAMVVYGDDGKPLWKTPLELAGGLWRAEPIFRRGAGGHELQGFVCLARYSGEVWMLDPDGKVIKKDKWPELNLRDVCVKYRGGHDDDDQILYGSQDSLVLRTWNDGERLRYALPVKGGFVNSLEPADGKTSDFVVGIATPANWKGQAEQKCYLVHIDAGGCEASQITGVEACAKEGVFVGTVDGHRITMTLGRGLGEVQINLSADGERKLASRRVSVNGDERPAFDGAMAVMQPDDGTPAEALVSCGYTLWKVGLPQIP